MSPAVVCYQRRVRIDLVEKSIQPLRNNLRFVPVAIPFEMLEQPFIVSEPSPEVSYYGSVDHWDHSFSSLSLGHSNPDPGNFRTVELNVLGFELGCFVCPHASDSL